MIMCWVHNDRDETFNHIICNRSTLAQKECRIRHDWVGVVIHWELCKRSKFDHADRWYIKKLESVPENEQHGQLGL